jgi:hypothetical protein
MSDIHSTSTSSDCTAGSVSQDTPEWIAHGYVMLIFCFSLLIIFRGFLLLIAGVAAMVWGMAFICEEFCVPSISVFCKRNHISDDIAGAIFIGTGLSLPVLFATFIGLFIEGSAIGIGTVVGGDIFNHLINIAVSIYVAPNRTLKLDGIVFTREMIFYFISCIFVIWSAHENLADSITNAFSHSQWTSCLSIPWHTSLVLVLNYVIYCLFDAYFDRISSFLQPFLFRIPILQHYFDASYTLARSNAPVPEVENIVDVTRNNYLDIECRIPTDDDIYFLTFQNYRNGDTGSVVHWRNNDMNSYIPSPPATSPSAAATTALLPPTIRNRNNSRGHSSTVLQTTEESKESAALHNNSLLSPGRDIESSISPPTAVTTLSCSSSSNSPSSRSVLSPLGETDFPQSLHQPHQQQPQRSNFGETILSHLSFSRSNHGATTARPSDHRRFTLIPTESDSARLTNNSNSLVTDQPSDTEEDFLNSRSSFRYHRQQQPQQQPQYNRLSQQLQQHHQSPSQQRRLQTEEDEFLGSPSYPSGRFPDGDDSPTSPTSFLAQYPYLLDDFSLFLRSTFYTRHDINGCIPTSKKWKLRYFQLTDEGMYYKLDYHSPMKGCHVRYINLYDIDRYEIEDIKLLEFSITIKTKKKKYYFRAPTSLIYNLVLYKLEWFCNENHKKNGF